MVARSLRAKAAVDCVGSTGLWTPTAGRGIRESDFLLVEVARYEIVRSVCGPLRFSAAPGPLGWADTSAGEEVEQWLAVGLAMEP